jgi:outer membrane protein OmpA-like peptidoglycan-associated protein
MIDGHTDTSERRSLSTKRAIAVRSYLVRAGLAIDEMTIRGNGSERLRVPTPPNTSERENRRVEITYGPPSE